VNRTAILFVLAFVACDGGEPVPQDTAPPVDTSATDTAIETIPPEPPTWQVTGQVGSVLAVHTIPSKFADETFRVSAVFADALQGFETAAGCVLPSPTICVQALPESDDAWTDTVNAFDLESRDYTWNGYEVSVDAIFMPFLNDQNRSVQYYDFVLDGPPLVADPVVAFSGEWGNYLSDGELKIPAFELLEPSASDNIDVTDGVGEFTWTPGGPGKPYLRLAWDDTVRTIQLADDGSYSLDWAGFGFGTTIQPDIWFGRWSVVESDINGNTLKLVGVTEQQIGAQVCDDFPEVNLAPANGGGSIGTEPHFVGVSLEGVVYDNALYDFEREGVPESARLIFNVLDDAARPLCTISFDASTYTASTNWATDSGMPLWQGYVFDLPVGRGNSNCGSVDQATFGTRDLRTFLEGFQWGIAIGQMSPAFATELSSALAAQWPLLEPVVHSVYVSQDGGFTGIESGYGRNMDTNGCFGVNDPPTPDERIANGPDLPDGFYTSTPYVVIPIQ
jgi:hypothetical protein